MTRGAYGAIAHPRRLMAPQRSRCPSHRWRIPPTGIPRPAGAATLDHDLCMRACLSWYRRRALRGRAGSAAGPRSDITMDGSSRPRRLCWACAAALTVISSSPSLRRLPLRCRSLGIRVWWLEAHRRQTTLLCLAPITPQLIRLQRLRAAGALPTRYLHPPDGPLVYLMSATVSLAQAPRERMARPELVTTACLLRSVGPQRRPVRHHGGQVVPSRFTREPPSTTSTCCGAGCPQWSAVGASLGPRVPHERLVRPLEALNPATT